MTNVPVMVGWLMPLVLPFLSYLTFRFLPGRGLRFKLYAPILLFIMSIDMFGISFMKDPLNAAIGMMVWFMVLEFFWLLTLIPMRKTVIVLICVGLASYLYGNLGWLRLGPHKIEKHWHTSVVATQQINQAFYLIKESESAQRRGGPAREIALERRRGILSDLRMERQIGSVTTNQFGKGFYISKFGYLWAQTDSGVCVKILTDKYRDGKLVEGKDTLWTISESLKNR